MQKRVHRWLRAAVAFLCATGGIEGQARGAVTAHEGGQIEVNGRFDPVTSGSRGTGTNLSIVGVELIDGSFQPIVPQVGQQFFVQVSFLYESPTCDGYRIRRQVNGWEPNDAPEINWGCGAGDGIWVHNWGSWFAFDEGTFPLTITLDPFDQVAEVDESDNTLQLQFTVAGGEIAEWQLTNLEQGRQLLGDGTDVVVGTMDDAFDFFHPWYVGNDSRGRPRLVAASQNTLRADGGPINEEHATRVMGATLARGLNAADMTGYAPDARFVTAEFLNRNGGTGHPVSHVLDAAGFLVEHDVDVINMSWSWWLDGTAADSEAGETAVTNLMVDYLAYGENILSVAAVNQLVDFDRPTAPGSSRNALTVGGMEDDLMRAWSEHDHGPTLDGRSKPDLLGNDSAFAPQASRSWRFGFPAVLAPGGTSAAAPHVTGAAAQLIDFGRANGEDLDQKVLRAVLVASAKKALDSDGSPWSNSSTQPLDDEQGAGVIDMVRAHSIYSRGAWSRNPSVPGYDRATVDGAVGLRGETGGRVVYELGSPHALGGDLNVALVFDRHTLWDDVNASGQIDEGDTFFVDPADVQDDLNLVLYRDGVEIASSRSSVDTVEHLHVSGLAAGDYTLHVERLDVSNSGPGEEFALALFSDTAWSTPLFSDGFEEGDTLAWSQAVP